MTNDGNTMPGAPFDSPAAAQGERAFDSPEATQDERDGVARKAEEYLAALQRERADFINFKRRTEQESKALASGVIAMTIERCLPVLDDFKLATSTVEPHIAALPWTQGILAVERKFEAVLESFGVKEIEIEGKPFDPRLCEAVMEGDGPANTVIAVLQRGFTIGDQLIRPARVVVGRGGIETEQTETTETQEATETNEG
jgi:molecular chaperone GrpE